MFETTCRSQEHSCRGADAKKELLIFYCVTHSVWESVKIEPRTRKKMSKVKAVGTDSYAIKSKAGDTISIKF